ncbi:polysaccharide biosynthesis C-terminal domain-containing protein [Paenibacillus harenae]|uniref:UDP-2-acetamido-2,6-beta-L-arabino-hexul-4-ose reductase n=1 Tax=Paenibacillus harenae TaxID=306543 RepID=A0ABT9U425_PAEHA|nr:NAD-dependent epimerase/dehydratase family protein [Paenibacillus harenae]MDQ0114392.1 UDP-2-acetamido-2,6-beta-L-arabino-hexul-4-ose reductase [Paenibacillus harenae]
MNVLVTGANGFLGKNMLEGLRRSSDVRILPFGRENRIEELEQFLIKADVVYHLAGVNRTEREEDFLMNEELMDSITGLLRKHHKTPIVVYASTIQASNANAYGMSKKAAEDTLIRYGEETGAPIYIFRLPNLFGKWSKPNYNSVVATFCHNIARGLAITISDPNKKLELAYVDDVVSWFIELLGEEKRSDNPYSTIPSTFAVTLGELAHTISAFRQLRETGILPLLNDPLTKYLYSTYLSYLPRDDFSYEIKTFHDHRGSLFEVIKSEAAGQIFVSTSFKGVERGHHYHNTKVEKFCVIKGKAVVKFRHIFEDIAFSYELSEEKRVVLDIPPGYTHSIENASEEELIVLFWANEIFQADRPDTYPSKV